MMFMWGAGGLVMLLMMLVCWGLVIAGVVVGLRWLVGQGRPAPAAMPSISGRGRRVMPRRRFVHATGKVTTTDRPRPPGPSSNATLARCNSAMRLTIDRPRPLPTCWLPGTR